MTSHPTPTRSRVLQADAAELARRGLRSLLADLPEVEVVAETCSDELRLAALCRQHQPHLVTLDAPDLAYAIAPLLETIQCASPSTRVMLVTQDAQPETLATALARGAHGYALKSAPCSALLRSVRRVLAGELVIDEALVRHAIGQAGSEATHPQIEPLTPREVEVLQLLVEGQTNRQIAEALVLARGTVKIHIEHILGKLGAADRTQAAVRAVELGLVRPTLACAAVAVRSARRRPTLV